MNHHEPPLTTINHQPWPFSIAFSSFWHKDWRFNPRPKIGGPGRTEELAEQAEETFEAAVCSGWEAWPRVTLEMVVNGG